MLLPVEAAERVVVRVGVGEAEEVGSGGIISAHVIVVVLVLVDHMQSKKSK